MVCNYPPYRGVKAIRRTIIKNQNYNYYWDKSNDIDQKSETETCWQNNAYNAKF